MNSTDRDKQVAETEELLGDRLDSAGFAKGLFFGQYLGDKLPPYPDLTVDQRASELVDRLKQFCVEKIDPAAIDRDEQIPQPVIDGLGKLGVLGACLPTSCGGLDFSQTSYCRLMEILGGHCASTALFVNAHHSIGPRALVLFGTAQQQERWLPKLASGQWLSAFALTEQEAGSDAAGVQTTATPAADGSGYLLNGEKRWITNGAIAHVLTVMARTPVPGSDQTKITAFLVTPDMPGFEAVEPRMAKCGVRGTVTSRLALRDVPVPKENVLGQLGKGLRVALTVLDFGRTTFGASCTGAAKFCIRRATDHANNRVQFGQPIGSFELVKAKLAAAAADTLAMEACTYQTAALIDAGQSEYMLETAMLKVFATETLWRIVNDTIQIHGGKAYFTDEPFERMMRDARINMIGEGANDVLRVFIALVGMRGVGLELEQIVGALQHPLGNLAHLARFTGRRLGSLLVAPAVDVRHPELEDDAGRLGRAVAALGNSTERLLRIHQKSILDRQYHLARIADTAIELYTSACVIRRLDQMLGQSDSSEKERRNTLATGRYYLRSAARRMKRNLTDLRDNDDELTTRLADTMLASHRNAV